IKLKYSNVPTPATIWKSLRSKDVTRQVRTFLWKSMHGANRIGKYWKNIPECEDRVTCHYCDEEEDLEHILLKCRRPGQDQIWKLAKDLWSKKHPDWPTLSMGIILGCCLAIFEAPETKRPEGSTAGLYRILITESLYLIWKLRCECVIGRDGEPPTENEIYNRWVHTINEHLEIDKNLTNELKFGKQYSLPPSLVLETWKGTLNDEKTLPDNWLNEAEVLVGIAPLGSRRSPTPPVVVG
ncbi:hypothetical protein B0H11DRAFT_1756412, partial [Mycena galericulata]